MCIRDRSTAVDLQQQSNTGTRVHIVFVCRSSAREHRAFRRTWYLDSSDFIKLLGTRQL